MKILYIYNLYQQAGGENLWVQSEPDLFKARGHGVIVYKRDNHEISTFSFARKASLLWQTRWSREAYLRIRSLIRKEQPDVAHVYNTLPLITPAAYYACWHEGVPVVQTIYNYRLLCPVGTFLRQGRICEECVQHSLWRSVRYGCYRQSRVQSAAVAWMLHSHRRWNTWNKLVDLYLVPTKFMQHKLIEGGLPRQKIIVKPNYHEPDPGLRESSSCDGSVLYVGRLTPEKGLLTLLKAWRLLRQQPSLRIIGEGPLRADVEKAAAQDPNNKIDFLGGQPHENVISCLKQAAFLVLPSEWYEAFPHVILEAYACGVPILASRVGTLADVIKDGETGVLFESGQPMDLAAKMQWMIDHPSEILQIATAARAEFETRYTADKNYDRLMKIYQVVASSGKTYNAGRELIPQENYSRFRATSNHSS